MGRGSWFTWVQRTMQDRKQKDKQAATERRVCGCIDFLLLRRGRGRGCWWWRFVASRVARGGEKVEAEAEKVEMVEVGMGM